MNYENLHARDYIEGLASRGRYHFSTAQIRKALVVSSPAALNALNRLARQGLIASPAKSFYVITPPEYKSLGCLPAEQFIPALMKQRELSYYAGLLSAAQYYGAAHHRPQSFQVFTAKNRRPIECGKVRAVFIARKNIELVPVRSFNTPRGTLAVSSPEATAIDLAGYPKHAGGLDQVATVLAELAESIDPELLPEAAKTAPLPWAQRLGYLLSLVGASEITGPLRAYVREHVNVYTKLLAGNKQTSGRRDQDWKLHINAEVEPEL